MNDSPYLDAGFRAAMGLAAVLHHGQDRPGTNVPLVATLMQSAVTVLEHGGDADETAAALLRWAADELDGEAALRRIEEACGPRAAAIVRECSERLDPDAPAGETWRGRKERLLVRIATIGASARLVLAASELCECRAMADDVRRGGEGAWNRFDAGRDDQLWYRRAAAGRLRASRPSPRLTELLDALDDAVLDLETLATRGSLAHALGIAARVHAAQRDKAGADYVLHPLRVMSALATPDERIAAVLHDVVEDGPGWTSDRLRREGFSEVVVTAVEALTKREGEDYLDFVRRAAAHPVARRVKLADLDDNMDLRRLPSVTDKDLERLRKYHAARRVLTEPPPSAG